MKKVSILLIALALSFGASAQLVTFYQPLGTNVASDTVTNTATNFLTATVSGYKNITTIQVVVTKISGTVGGTISLLGSVETSGNNFKALNTRDSQTALPTITATDASNVYHWRVTGNDFARYRVSWTGTGTMAASFSAKALAK